MKKILIATSALAAVSATSAFALDVTTTGTVEYRYTKDKVANVAQNAKLSQKKAEVKFAAEGASNGLAYGAWVKVKSSTAKAAKAAGTVTTTALAKATNANLAHSRNGYTQDGLAVATVSYAGDKDGAIYVEGTPAVTAVAGNNATTESALWVSGSFGKVVVGQDGNAADDNAVTGAVKAASFADGDLISASNVATASGERVTYTAPEFVKGLTLAYTHQFKGNVDTAKTAKAKGASEWAVAYTTNVYGVGIKAAHAVAKTSAQNKTTTATLATAQYNSASPTATANGVTVSGNTVTVDKSAPNKNLTNTVSGLEATYGNFTVGYGVFSNEKKHYQTKDIEGSNYGVKYASGAWAVGYTVKKVEDKNKYYGVSKKEATTSAISASYTVAEGFSVYASRATNNVKKTDNTKAKATYTIIGAKISF